MTENNNSSNLTPSRRYLSDACIISSSLLVIYFSRYAGIADAIYGYIYVVLIIGYRFVKLGQPLSSTAALLHVAASVSIISSFDKVIGYHNGSGNEIPVLISGLVVAFISVIYAFRFKSLIPLIAPLLLFSEVIVLPLELTKNITARFIYEDIPPVYVTKIDPPYIYGVSLYNKDRIVRFSKKEGGYHADSYIDIEFLGGGSMDYQEAKFPFQSYQIMQALNAKQKVPGRQSSIDSIKDAELAKILDQNYSTLELLHKKLVSDAHNRDLKYIFSSSQGDIRVLCSCNRYKYCSEPCLSSSAEQYADELSKFSVRSVKIEKDRGMIYLVTEKNTFQHQLFTRERGFAFSLDSTDQHAQSDQELLPVRAGWYVFDRRL